MNTNTGDIADLEHFRNTMTPEDFGKYVRPVDEVNGMSDATKSLLKKHGKVRVGFNHYCPCGSRKRFKSCCKSKE